MESEEELEILLAFQNGDRVPETPPVSPSHICAQNQRSSASLSFVQAKQRNATDPREVECPSPDKTAASLKVQEIFRQVFGYDSDEDTSMPNKNVSMEAFREVVNASLNTAVHKTSSFGARQPRGPIANGIDVELHSGLRIRNALVTSATLSNRLSAIRFVRLQAIRTAMMGENITGAWATVGVLTEKGMPKVSSTGKKFAIWKLASLDTTTVSLFLFGDAYTQHWKESAGSIAAVFNAKVRRDDMRNEFSLSIFASDQLTKLGTSVDYCICKGLRKDGTPCSTVVNRRHGQYCQYHTTAIRQKFKSRQGELSGGNLATGFTSPNKFIGSQGMREASDSIADGKPQKPLKHMTSKDLQKVLSNADKVTTKYQSQGIRFLASLADGSRENLEPMHGLKWQSKKQHGTTQKRACLDKSIGVGLLQKKTTKEKVVGRPGLIELDIEGPDGGSDDAMAEAISIFQKG